MTLGEKIKTKRKELGLTYQDIADIVGVTRATVMRWEKNEIVSIKVTKLKQLAKVLKVDPTYFLDIETQPKNNLKEMEYEILKLVCQMDFKAKLDVYNFCVERLNKNEN